MRKAGRPGRKRKHAQVSSGAQWDSHPQSSLSLTLPSSNCSPLTPKKRISLLCWWWKWLPNGAAPVLLAQGMAQGNSSPKEQPRCCWHRAWHRIAQTLVWH